MIYYYLFIIVHFFATSGKCWIVHNTWQKSLDGNEVDQQQSPKERFNLIFSGTKWCGSGNVASDYNDLGSAEETDICCRAHDNCADAIEAGKSNHGLSNNAFYTRLSCKCDEQFYDCLKSNDDYVSNKVGVTYFDVLGTQCFRKDYPIKRCLRYNRFLRNRCEEYELDTTGEQKWQWFDVPLY